MNALVLIAIISVGGASALSGLSYLVRRAWFVRKYPHILKDRRVYCSEVLEGIPLECTRIKKWDKTGMKITPIQSGSIQDV